MFSNSRFNRLHLEESLMQMKKNTTYNWIRAIEFQMSLLLTLFYPTKNKMPDNSHQGSFLMVTIIYNM